MELFIDIGNTNSSIALSRSGKVLKVFFITTNKKNLREDSLKRLLSRWLNEIDRIVIVSVVPFFLGRLKRLLLKVLPDASLQVVGEHITVPIENTYSAPEEVGQDRLLSSFAAKHYYGTPCIVVDFGTAVTFDVVNKKGQYEGGIIFPGMRVSFKNLLESAALIGKFELDEAGKVPIVGKNTHDSIRSGLFRGYAAMCDGIITRLCDDMDEKPHIIATGGDAAIIEPFSEHLKNIDEILLFKGLSCIIQ